MQKNRLNMKNTSQNLNDNADTYFFPQSAFPSSFTILGKSSKCLNIMT